jgi:pSer/pThr/pTyr-binding forkhead associated (FHA) protein
MRSWVIGSSADCDVVVDSPLASGRHCQLTQKSDGFFLEDLGSTNGTYVGGNRITSARRVTPAEAITLGQTVSMPWPPELARFVRIGRITGNDIVLDDPRVSSHHARLMIVAGSDTLIEDVGSSNGTFLNSAENRVTQPTPLTSSDTVYFGSLAVPAARLLAGRIEPVANVPVPSAADHSKEPRPEPAAAMPALGSIAGIRWLLASLAQAPVLAVLIVLIFGRRSSAVITVENSASVEQGIAATSFALALAAVWLGCSFAVGELAAGRWPSRLDKVDPATVFVSLGSRLAVLVMAGCAILLAIVYRATGLNGQWLAMWGILVMASTVGLLLGLVVSTLATTWQNVAVILVLTFVPMFTLAGWFWLLPNRPLPVRMAAAAMPTRWAFEGVLLLESPHHRPAAVADDPLPTPKRDLAEEFFPAESERMGPRADAMALASMVIGLAAAVVLLCGKPK